MISTIKYTPHTIQLLPTVETIIVFYNLDGFSRWQKLTYQVGTDLIQMKPKLDDLNRTYRCTDIVSFVLRGRKISYSVCLYENPRPHPAHFLMYIGWAVHTEHVITV